MEIMNDVHKFQAGGSYSPPYVVYTSTPHVSTATGEVVPDTKKAAASELGDKDLFKMLDKLDGLPSDMTVLADNLQNFYSSIDTPYGVPQDTASIESRYIAVLNQMKVANFNKKEYDNAYNQVSKNGGLEEFAVTERGQLICTDGKGDFKYLTPEQLKEGQGDGYSPLTNSELLNLRAYNQDLAYNSNILSVVKTGIGMEKVTELILQSLNKIGSNEQSQEGYFAVPKGTIISGLEDFTQAVQQAAGSLNYDGTVEDLYKYKYLTKDQADQASAAFNYIYSTLPENAKAILKTKSDLTDNGAQQLVQTLVASKIDTKQDFSVDLKTPKESAGGSGGGGESDKLKLTPLYQIQNNIGGIEQSMTVDRGDGIQLSLYGRMYPRVTEADSSKAIENTSLASMLAQSGIQAFTKLRGITFGDQEIDPELLNNITYNNIGVMRVNLPVNSDGTVNLQVLDAYQKVEADVAALGENPSNEDIAKIYEQYGLSNLLLANGMPNPDKFAPFLVTEGYTTDGLTGIQESDYVKEYSGDSERAYDLIEQSLANAGNEVELDRDSYAPGDWFGMYDHIYKAVIYIPIDNNALNATTADRQKLPYSEGMQLEEDYQDFPKRQRMQTTSADVLNNN